MTKKAFWETSLLGVSLRRANLNIPIRHTVAYENRAGLPSIYNAALDAMDADETAVFVHDDVVLYDFFLPLRLHDSLRCFDVIGSVGNAKPAANHCSWYLRLPVGQDTIVTDQPNEAGDGVSRAINHLFPTRDLFSNFDPPPRRVALLDGLFLAARVSTLRRRGVRFDEKFDFHFYDLNFSRTCVSRGLKIST
jgi:hypothetical protein